MARGKSFPLEVSNLGKRVDEGSDSPPTALDGGLDKNLNMSSLPHVEVQAEGERDGRSTRTPRRRSASTKASLASLAVAPWGSEQFCIALFDATGAAASPTSPT